MNKNVRQVFCALPGFSLYKNLTQAKYGLAFTRYHICEHILSFAVLQFISFQFYIFRMVISMNQLVKVA